MTTHWLASVIAAMARGFAPRRDEDRRVPREAPRRPRSEVLARMRDDWATNNQENLDPKSIDDDLKLFGFPPGIEQRREIAYAVRRDLSFGPADYRGTAEQNEELHKAFLDAVLPE